MLHGSIFYVTPVLKHLKFILKINRTQIHVQEETIVKVSDKSLKCTVNDTL